MPSRLPLAHLPPSGDVEGWVKAKATEIKGEDRGRPLYHFELWLDPPEDVKQRLAAVAYDFDTPAVMPNRKSQASRRRASASALAAWPAPTRSRSRSNSKTASRSKSLSTVAGC
jgi:hypothetical protein